MIITIDFPLVFGPEIHLIEMGVLVPCILFLESQRIDELLLEME